jgi:Ca2+:H+ antiporter
MAALGLGGGLYWDPGPDWLAGLAFAWVIVVMFWCAFGVIERAEHLAEALGEPLGTLILTISIVAIEVGLISAVMLGGDANATVGRDTMFAVVMIVLNGVVGLALLIGGLRHHEQSYNLPGALAYLIVIIPLAVIALVLPRFTTTTEAGTLSAGQAIAFALCTLVLYGIFLAVQTGRHRGFFVEPGERPEDIPHAGLPADPERRAAVRSDTLLLVATVLPIVLLSKTLGAILDRGLVEADAPLALGGLLIALIIFTPEGVSALRAAHRNELQRTVNLCLGACLSTVGLTVPAVLMIGLVTGEDVVLGLDGTGIVLLALTLVLSMVTFSGSRTTVLEGAVHVVVFLVFLVLIFSP